VSLSVTRLACGWKGYEENVMIVEVYSDRSNGMVFEGRVVMFWK
jgi:hypothetical protein